MVKEDTLKRETHSHFMFRHRAKNEENIPPCACLYRCVLMLRIPYAICWASSADTPMSWFHLAQLRHHQVFAFIRAPQQQRCPPPVRLGKSIFATLGTCIYFCDNIEIPLDDDAESVVGAHAIGALQYQYLTRSQLKDRTRWFYLGCDARGALLSSCLAPLGIVAPESNV